MEHIKIHIRRFQNTSENGFAEVTDVETDGRKFYEEIYSERAKEFVECWNCHDELQAKADSRDALLAACEFAKEELESSRKKNKMGCMFPFLTAEVVCKKLEQAIKAGEK